VSHHSSGVPIVTITGDAVKLHAHLAWPRPLDWSSNFPAIVEAIKKLPAKSAIIDGEAVILDDNGVPHFSSLQQAFAKGGGKATQ
jgi:hypothetical protein